MATTQKVLNFFGDSITLSSFNFMTWREFLLQRRPDFQASGTVQDVKIGPQSYTAAVRSSWFGQNRSYCSATNGITVGGMAAVVAARLGSVSPTATHAIVHLEMNDALGGIPAATSLSDMNTLVTNARAAVPTLKLLVVKCFNQLLSSPAQTIINNFNSGLAAALAGHAAYCWTTDNATMATEDFGDVQTVHLNARGALRMALAIDAAPAAFWT